MMKRMFKGKRGKIIKQIVGRTKKKGDKYLKDFIVVGIGGVVESEKLSIAEPRVRDIRIGFGRLCVNHDTRRE